MPPDFNGLRRVLLILVGLLALGVGAWLLLRPVLRERKPEQRSSVKGGTILSTASRAPQPLPPVQAVDFVGALLARLDPQRPAVSREQLAQLHAQLGTLARDEAARQLVAFLDSGKNATTGMQLRVGKGGWLETASTLRVAALDWLPEFDSTAAFGYARRLFANSDSADEWAVALRNYYWKSRSADAYFVARVQEVFGREAWTQSPSAGLMESVDFAVAIGGAEGLGILRGVLEKSPQLRWPGLAALDAWVLEDRHAAIPLLTVSAGAAGETLDEHSRAALLSRADVRDEAQRVAIGTYLESAAVAQEVKTEFLRQFPNQSMIVGNHFVTQQRPMTLENSAQLDAAALAFVDEIVRTGRCPDLGAELAASRARLASYVESARRGGKL